MTSIASLLFACLVRVDAVAQQVPPKPKPTLADIDLRLAQGASHYRLQRNLEDELRALEDRIDGPRHDSQAYMLAAQIEQAKRDKAAAFNDVKDMTIIHFELAPRREQQAGFNLLTSQKGKGALWNPVYQERVDHKS